jgi:hypothetical protein
LVTSGALASGLDIGAEAGSKLFTITKGRLYISLCMRMSRRGLERYRSRITGHSNKSFSTVRQRICFAAQSQFILESCRAADVEALPHFILRVVSTPRYLNLHASSSEACPMLVNSPSRQVGIFGASGIRYTRNCMAQ